MCTDIWNLRRQFPRVEHILSCLRVRAQIHPGEVQGLQQSAIELQRRRRASGATQRQQSNGFCGCFASPRSAIAGSAGLQKFEEAKVTNAAELQQSMCL